MNDCHGPGAWLWALLAGAEAARARLEAEVQAASGLTLPQLGFLHHVAHAGGELPLGQVADCLACVRSNATQLADRLEAQGLVRREPDPADRRSVRAVITAQGRERLLEGQVARARAEHALAEALGVQGGTALAELLARLRVAVGETTATVGGEGKP